MKYIRKKFKYIYQGDTTYLILYDDKKLCYINLENFDFVIIENFYLNKIIDKLYFDLLEDKGALYE